MNFRDAQRIMLFAVALTVAAFGEVLGQTQVPTIVVPENSGKREAVKIDPEILKVLKPLNGMFAEAATLWSAKNYAAARTEYGKVLAMTSAPSHYKSYAHQRIAQSYAAEKNTAAAKGVCAEAAASCETKVEGIPAILLEVIDLEDPIEVGAQTTYEIKVTNQRGEHVADLRGVTVQRNG